MRKSNILILAILLIASIFFLWLWYYLEFDLIDNPLDLVLSIVWWAVIIAACVGIHKAEKKRQERVRTAFVAPNAVYNSEAGVVRMAPGASAVEAVQDILQNLQYNFDIAAFPNKMMFQYVVRTRTFKVDDAETGEVTWEGEVALADCPDDEPKPFANRAELLALIG